MKRWLAIAFLLVAAVPVMADVHADAKAEVQFGVTCARKGLWREAIFRWKNAVAKDEKYAEAWNDLAVGYEQLGDLDNARKAYETALHLDANNAYIRQNYDEFRNIYDRQNRRNGVH
jgi:Flp pilus assembly protein TadD